MNETKSQLLALKIECEKHGTQPVFITTFLVPKIKVRGCYQCILEFNSSEESRGSKEQA